MRWLVLVGGVLAVVDAGVVVWPLGAERDERAVAPARERVVSGQVKRGGIETGWVAAVLGRPLFEPGRRAPGLEVVVVAETETIPRLTGIVVSDTTRRALFAEPERAARGEGERLGAFTVMSIRAGAVELAGPEGVRTVYPADDAGFRAELAAARPLAAMVGGEERERRTENDQ